MAERRLTIAQQDEALVRCLNAFSGGVERPPLRVTVAECVTAASGPVGGGADSSAQQVEVDGQPWGEQGADAANGGRRALTSSPWQRHFSIRWSLLV
jgi:hypothetical protein